VAAVDRRTVRSLVERLNRDAEQISRRFGLRYKSVTAERANVTSRYGSCYEDGVIKIRLRHAVTGKPLKYSSLVNTLCHELAHLRYFHHGERFKSFYLQILEYARAQRIYRPGRPADGAAAPSPARQPAREEAGPEEPVQLALF
jgi:predicted metal-dependent hydrolase